ncbi:hypothetical protein AXG93_1962s1270 [Marchantia polymorpha subsp. ruderalis]|uniref:Uncharacterized protein n=1 Tax=Marchantia polymorpha subsp. ruderalis TaxID=1480154 RepID=A0A176WDK2_MARPO|nr:hypothetical protein AXG93_1962s1270 [Marchantia polymorpha subsp. ruderalis]
MREAVSCKKATTDERVGKTAGGRGPLALKKQRHAQTRTRRAPIAAQNEESSNASLDGRTRARQSGRQTGLRARRGGVRLPPHSQVRWVPTAAAAAAEGEHRPEPEHPRNRSDEEREQNRSQRQKNRRKAKQARDRRGTGPEPRRRPGRKVGEKGLGLSAGHCDGMGANDDDEIQQALQTCNQRAGAERRANQPSPRPRQASGQACDDGRKKGREAEQICGSVAAQAGRRAGRQNRGGRGRGGQRRGTGWGKPRAESERGFMVQMRTEAGPPGKRGALPGTRMLVDDRRSAVTGRGAGPGVGPYGHRPATC